MKLLIAVGTCWQYSYPKWVGHPLHRKSDHRIASLLETWWPTAEMERDVEATFFYGTPRNSAVNGPPHSASSIVMLNAPDDYDGLKYKLQAICGWAGDRYDFILRIDDDTAVDVPMLAAIARVLGPQDDYIGQVCGNYCYGGAGILLSKRAANLIALRPIAPDPFGVNPVADDHWAGKVLTEAGIVPKHDPRFNSEQGVTLHCREVGLMQKWWKLKTSR